MSTTTNNNKKTSDEKIAAKDSRIKQLQKEKQAIIKRENAKARKERNYRLYRRHGLLEKFMPDLITITDDQFEAFVRTGIATSYGIKRIGEIKDKGEEAATTYIIKCRVEEKAQAEAEQAEQAKSQHANDNGNGVNSPQAVSSGA